MSAPLTLGPVKDLKMTIFFTKTEQKRTAPLSLDSVFHLYRTILQALIERYPTLRGLDSNNISLYAYMPICLYAYIGI